MAEPLPHQRQTDEIAIFIAVADDGAAFGGKGQHNHQLGFGAGFQADGNFIVFRHDQVFDHALLLVDFNRVDGGVAALIVVFADGAVESAAQAQRPILQDIGKAEQHRQILAALVKLVHQIVQADSGLAVGIGTHHHFAVVGNEKIAVAPVFDAVGGCRSIDTPCHVRIPCVWRFAGAPAA